MPHEAHDRNHEEDREDRGSDNVSFERELFGCGHAIGDEKPRDEDDDHADAGPHASADRAVVRQRDAIHLEMRFLTAHERWVPPVRN